MLVESHSQRNNDCFDLLWVALYKRPVRQSPSSIGEGQLNVFHMSCASSVVVQHPFQPSSVENCKSLSSVNVVDCLNEKWLLRGRVEVAFVHSLMHRGWERLSLALVKLLLHSSAPAHIKSSAPGELIKAKGCWHLTEWDEKESQVTAVDAISHLKFQFRFLLSLYYTSNV